VRDRESPYQICLSAHGTSGHGVAREHYSTDNQERTTVAAANVCGECRCLDGGSATWPFSQESGHLNDKYKNDIIIQMYNTAENLLYYLGDNVYRAARQYVERRKGPATFICWVS
jgi:hypothetical protein